MISTAVLNKVTFPLFSKVKNDIPRLKSMYKKVMEVSLFIVAPILLFMGVLAEPLFRFLFTEKWMPAVPYFQLLCVPGILYPLSAYNLNVLNVLGRSDLFLKLEIIKKIIVLASVIIGLQYGIYGLLIATIIVSAIALFINSHYTGKFINYNLLQQLKGLFPILLISLLSAGAIFYIDKQLVIFSFNDLTRLLLGAILGTMLFIGASFMFRIPAAHYIYNIIRRR